METVLTEGIWVTHKWWIRLDSYPPYWTDPTEESFDVYIEDVKKDGEKYQVILREDVIRPAGGGQAGDRGILRVKDRTVSIADKSFWGVGNPRI